MRSLQPCAWGRFLFEGSAEGLAACFVILRIDRYCDWAGVQSPMALAQTVRARNSIAGKCPMPRGKRIRPGGTALHVPNRGNQRQALSLFQSSGDYEAFVRAIVVLCRCATGHCHVRKTGCAGSTHQRPLRKSTPCEHATRAAPSTGSLPGWIRRPKHLTLPSLPGQPT